MKVAPDPSPSLRAAIDPRLNGTDLPSQGSMPSRISAATRNDTKAKPYARATGTLRTATAKF